MPSRSGTYTAAMPREQQHPKLIFELMDTAAQCGLFKAERRRRLAEAAMLVGGYDITQMPKLNRHHNGDLLFFACDMKKEKMNRVFAIHIHALLMAYGLRNIADDYGRSFLAIAESTTGQLTAAKNTWRQIMDASGRAPRAMSRRTPKLSPTEARRRVRRKQRPDT